jgi:hypothetical protein
MNHPHHHDHSGHHHQDKPPRQFHKDWRVWVVVVVILAAMAIYVLTNGEVIRRASPPQSAPASQPTQ